MRLENLSGEVGLCDGDGDRPLSIADGTPRRLNASFWELKAGRRRLDNQSREIAMRKRVLVLLFAVAGVASAVWPASTAATKPRPGIVPLAVLKSHGAVIALAPVTVHGHTYVFAIDTGASVSAINSSVAAQLRLPKAGPPARLLAAGCRTTAQPVRVTDWRVGGVRLPSARVVSLGLGLPKGLDGLLGSDLFAQFGHITLDYSRQLLRLGG